jgi:hypothetical protein
VVQGIKLDLLIPLKFTPTPLPAPTHTPMTTLSTFTPTPILAYIANTAGVGVYMREQPNSKVIPGALSEGALVKILYCSETVNGFEWIEISDLFRRVGWVRASNLVIRP